ncbi:hypothetical protein CAEBREN_24927 [Caenorhabditis brenneri]|uniref:Glucosylceramidase n=1 Tax=Caenorhabditis brenneri TaxID=135651 RepID=G0NYN3_CAEBE|nr:hypothetical protein CAEBREN_24927 [Caenorhabditis brenneri]
MLLKVSLLLFIGLAEFLIEAKSLPCSQVQKDHGIVCRCNATYCDTIEPLGTVTAGKAVVYTTSRKGKRMERSELKHSTSSSGSTTSQSGIKDERITKT